MDRLFMDHGYVFPLGTMQGEELGSGTSPIAKRRLGPYTSGPNITIQNLTSRNKKLSAVFK